MMQTCPQCDKYEDFCDGSYFKSHPLFSSNKFALQIQLYYDNLECANPLGSKKGIHKVFYFILRNLPPRVNSALMNRIENNSLMSLHRIQRNWMAVLLVLIDEKKSYKIV